MKHSVEEIKLKSGARGLLIDIPGASVMSTRIQLRNLKMSRRMRRSLPKMALITMLGLATYLYATRQNVLILSGKG